MYGEKIPAVYPGFLLSSLRGRCRGTELAGSWEKFAGSLGGKMRLSVCVEAMRSHIHEGIEIGWHSRVGSLAISKMEI